MSCKCGIPKDFCRRVDTIRIDNHSVGEGRPLGPGLVAFPQDDHVATYTLSNGAVASGIPIPATGQGTWADWNQQHAEIFAPLVGKNGFRAAQAADGNPITAWANHAAMECCPGDVTIVSAVLTVVGGARDGRVVPLAIEHDKGEIEEFVKCANCDPTKVVWKNSDGEIIEKPEGCLFADCQFPPDPVFPPAPDCSVQTLGPLCAFDGDDTENPVDTGIFLDIEDCEGARTRILYTLPDGLDGDPVIYEPGELNVRNCDGSPVEEPPLPECAEPTIDKCVINGCSDAFAVTAGRPNNSAMWILELADGRVITGETYAEFSDAMAAAGFTEYISGPSIESHRFCPYIPGTLTVVTNEGDEVTELTPISHVEDENMPAPEYGCVQWTVGKNDDRILELLEAIVANTNTELFEDCDGNLYKVNKCTGEVEAGPFKAPEVQVQEAAEETKTLSVGAIKTAVKATLQPVRIVTER